MTRSLILSGGGAYADPWHPFAATSQRIARILESLGHDVEVNDLVADRVADLGGYDLIVVNAAAGPDADTSRAQAGLMAARPGHRRPRCPRRRLHAAAPAAVGVGDRRGLGGWPVHA